jgi:type I restriction enzyme S subunit
MVGNEWRSAYLEDIADEITVGHVGSMASEYVSEGVPFLRSQNVEPLQINDKDMKFISKAFHERLRKSALSPGDVVIVRTGKPGACAVVPASLPVANCSDLVIVRCGPNLDARFLSYYVNSVATHHIDSHLVGAVQQHFNVGSARRMLLQLPSIFEQREIARILGMLDDKIELNRLMSGTLEVIARALFKSWFVDFDPVRAKVEGYDLKLDNKLAALFPTVLAKSELGEIPEGWRVGSADEEFSLTMGQSPPGETYNENGEGLPFYQGSSDFGFRFPRRRVYCTAPSRFAKAGDTLVSVRAPVGDINVATQDCAIGRGVAAARHKSGSRSYSYQFMRSIKDVFAKFEAEGTVFGSIGKKDFGAIPCIIPPREIVLAYETLVADLDDRVEVNEREIAALVNIRDSLLPKLISGEIRIAKGSPASEAPR